MAEIRIQGPDGSSFSFPEGTPSDTITAAMAAHYGGASTPPAAPEPAAEPYQPAVGIAGKSELRDETAAAIGGALEGIPIIGGALREGGNKFGAFLRSQYYDMPYDQALDQIRAETGQAAEQNPVADFGGQVAGAIAPMAALAATTGGASLLGVSQSSLPMRAGMAALSNSAISGLDAKARGGDAADTLTAMGISGTLGGAIPLAGAAARSAYGAVSNTVGGMVRGAVNPEKQAGLRVGRAIMRDRSSGQDVLKAADEATATTNGQQLLNVDRGGELTRALARSAANQSPEARATITKVADDRWAAQGDRTARTFRRIMGGDVDDIQTQENLKVAARAFNKPRYDAAYNSPAAQSVWDADLQQLMQSPTVQAAVAKATTTGADKTALTGGKTIRNPFVFGRGSVKLRQNPDGSTAVPSLQFWDEVQRNLRKASDALGPKEAAAKADIEGLRRALNQKLDTLVPEFGAARGGAAQAFGAEDALEAGKVFARGTRNVPEMEKLVAGLNTFDRKLFETGYASEVMDAIKNTNDRSSAIRFFKSPEQREKLGMVLGPKRAQELDAYIRVEDAADRIRGALGNSTTARQLVEMGLVGGGTWAYTGDVSSGAIAALGTKAARMLGGKVDERVTKRVAEMLASEDPKIIERAVANATLSPEWLKAVDAVAAATGVAARGGAVAGVASE